MNRKPWDWQGWSAAAIPALTLLVFAVGMDTGQRRASSEARMPVATVAAPNIRPVAATVVPAPPEPHRLVLVEVRQTARARTRRIVLLSVERKVSLNYRLQNCPARAPDTQVRSCRLLVDGGREQSFLRTVFRLPRNGRALWQPLQTGLGLAGRQVDGLWGPVTRTRFLETAVASLQPPPISFRFPDSGPADLIFMPAAPAVAIARR
jgi:hypothetical protein